MPEGEDQPVRRTGPRQLTWILLLILVLVGWGLIPPAQEAERELATIQSAPPPVQQATGRLLEVYEDARPATVRIEAHCSSAPNNHPAAGIGTGFFIDADGMLLTAYHVVRAQSLGPF